MTDEELLLVRAKIPNFSGLGYDKTSGEDTVIFYRGDGNGEPQYEIPVGELLDIVQYLKVFHPWAVIGANTTLELLEEE